ncbi:peptidoglycan DD-metalloendopeptidase family protein [Staphylococcus shinii]|uniref:peptidoglycan DD-metalloendopeptidase family protein n=2 Tax=Staphylococcus TaxID=1279 RepID=UPI003D801F99
MAERIKGLQIDLSMKDMGVSKTLAGIKREFRSLDSSLKLSSNNFKYGEKSAASYKSRMNDLDGAIKSGTTNLNELEKQYNEVSQAQGSNSAKAVRLQTEYNKQANSINAMRDEYGRLNQYYKENFSLSGKLANRFSSIGESMSGVGQKAQDMGSSLTSSITKPALIAGTAMAGITAKLGFDRLVGLDSAKAKLEGLGYSTKEVGSITDQVAKAIQGGMTTMAEGTDVAAGALAAGVKEGKELQKYIKLVGDAAVGSNRPVSEMAMIFNRVQGQGKLMTEELNMVEEGMPGFSNAMAKHLGVSYDAFRKMVTEGEVSSKDFLTVMDDFAGGMAGAYSKSWSGMVQNTKAYIGQIGESLLGGVFEQAKGSLHEFESLLKSPGAQQWAKETGEKIGSAFSKLTSGISSVIKWWQSLDGGTQKTLGGIVKWLGITLVTMGPVLTIFGKFTSMIGGMFSGLSGLIKFFTRHNAAAKISTASQALWNGVTATARGIANGYRYAIAALTTSQTAQAIKSKVAAAATVVWTSVTKAATVATRGLGLAIRFMTGPVGIVITAITALVGGIIYLWKTNSTFRNAVISAWNAIKKAAISVFGFIKPYIINIWNAIKKSSITVWNTLKKVATTTWNGIKYAIQNPIKALKNVLSTLWNGMKAAAIKIWTLLKNGVVAIIKAYVNQARANFNLVKRIVVTIFNSIKSFAIKVWNAIKNGIINIVTVLRSRITNTFNALKKGIISIFNAVKNFSLKLWTNIKNGVVSRAKSLWNGVKSMFTNLRNSVNSITSKIRNFLYSVWNAIKNKVVSLAKALWNGVKDKFNSLSTGTRKIFNAVRNYLVDKWTNIKDKVVGMATGIKDKVTGAFGVMRDSLKKIIGKITGFFDDMMGGVEKGLNSLIKGINKVGSMLGMGKEMIKPVKLSTGTEGASGNVVSNGAISSPTLATVNDSGPGNARGIGGYQELVQKSNGSVFAPQGKDATVMLDKGDRVINGRTTAKLQKTGQIPKFSKGTGKNKKKDKNLLEQGWDAVNGTYESAKHGISKGMQKTGEALTSAGKFSKDWITKNIGDVMDWIKKPGKLLNKILDGMGVGMSSFGIKKGNVPYDLMGGMFKKLKSAATDLIKSWFEEAEGGEGDAGWLLKHDIWQKFGNYTGGLGFNGGKHYGIDFGMTPGTNVKAVAGGKVSKVWNDYGGGKSIEVDIGKGLTNWYMHLSKQLVSKGQKVGVGDLIAKSGNTGAFTAGSGHLHFQLNKNGKPQSNVLEWLKGLGGGGKKKPSAWGSTIDKAAKKMKVNLSSAEKRYHSPNI